MWMMLILVWTTIQGYSKTSAVVPIDASHHFLLALDSNLTSIFNRSWDITPSLLIYTTPLFQLEPEKTAGSRWACFGARVPRTFNYQTIILFLYVYMLCDVLSYCVLWCLCCLSDVVINQWSYDKFKSALTCTVWSQCTPVPDRETDGQTDIMAIARRFVL